MNFRHIYFKYKRFCVLLSLIFFSALMLNAQYGTKAQIRNVDFKQIDNKVFITYDLIKARKSEMFDINVNIFSSGGYKIDTRSFTGDFSNVRKGKDKQIIWYLGEDYANFEDNIYVELTAFHKNHMIISPVSKFEALCKSTLFPGWGSSQTTLKKSNYIKGFFAYGFLGTSIRFYNLSKDEAWKASITNTEEKKDFYTKNERFYLGVSYVSLGLAGVMWIWEYSTILSKPNISKNIKLDVDLGYNQKNIVPLLSMKAYF